MGLCQSYIMNSHFRSANELISNKTKTELVTNKELVANTKTELVTNINSELININPKVVPYFTWKGKIFLAKPCNIYDGDTFSICWIWKGDSIKYRCRCLGYDSPEMKPLLSNPNRDKEKELAKKAKERFEELIFANPDQVVKIECGDFDKYGRILVTVWNNINEKSINEIMIEEGHGKPYNGGTKELWD